MDDKKVPKPRLSIIAAIGQNRELGKHGDLIWRISADLKRVKTLTMGHPIIMGRKTYDSIGRPLPGRTNIVVSRNPAAIPGCTVCGSCEEALAFANSIEEDEVFVFGGSSIYAEMLPLADRLYLTCVEATDPDADTFFPDFSDFTRLVSVEPGQQDGLSYSYQILER